MWRLTGILRSINERKRARTNAENSEPIQQAKRLAAYLESWALLDRIKGEQMLEAMGDDSPIALAQLMRFEAGGIKEGRKNAWKILGGLSLLMGIVCAGYLPWVNPLNGGRILGVIVCVCLGVVISNRERSQAVRLLVQYYENIRIVGPLLEALEFRNSQTRYLAIQKLIELLPQMQTVDLERLDSRQRVCLRNALGVKNSAFVLNVLAAIEKLEDTAAIPGVEKLAAGEGIAGDSNDVFETATRCLPVLRARLEREIVAKTLLRASSGETFPDQLLRSVEEAPNASGEQLLRAGEGEIREEVRLATTERTPKEETEVVLGRVR